MPDDIFDNYGDSSMENQYDDSFIEDHFGDILGSDMDEPASATEMCLVDDCDTLNGLDAESMGLAFALAEDIAETDIIRHGFNPRRNSHINDAMRTKCLNDGFDDDEVPLDPEEMYIIKYGDKFFQ